MYFFTFKITYAYGIPDFFLNRIQIFIRSTKEIPVLAVLAGYIMFYPQIGVKPCSMAGGGVSKNIWNCFRTAPEGTGQPLTCSTSGMGLRLK